MNHLPPSMLTARLRGLATVFALSGAIAGLLGCGQVQNGATTQYAQLRVIDASPDAGGVDVLVGSSTLAYNIGFTSVVNYAPVVPGTYTLSVNQANSKNVVTSTRGTLTASTQYSLLISSTSSGVQSQLLTDQSSPAPGGQSLVRFIDEASKIGSVDIYMVPNGGSLLTTNPVATSVSLSSIVAGISVPTNTYQIVLLPAGTVPTAATATTSAKVPLYTSASTSFPSASARTVVLMDTQIVSTPAVQVIILSDYDSPYSS